MTLDGKTILITGGSGGMGVAMARRFAASGAGIAVCDLSDDAVKNVVEDLAKNGYDALAVPADTTKPNDMDDAVAAAVDHFGSIEGLVTAAGIRQAAAGFREIDLDRWRTIQEINVTGTLIAIRAAADALIASSGAIVTVSSVTANAARMNQSAYCTSKAAVLHLTRQVALELAEHGVRANAICPGVTATPMIEQGARTDGPSYLRDKVEGSLKAFRPGIPMGRLARPEEQAAAAEFLLSAESSFITGTAMYVDGGVSMLG